MSSFGDTVDPATFADLPAEEVGFSIQRSWDGSDPHRLTAAGVFDARDRLGEAPATQSRTRAARPLPARGFDA